MPNHAERTNICIGVELLNASQESIVEFKLCNHYMKPFKSCQVPAGHKGTRRGMIRPLDI